MVGGLPGKPFVFMEFEQGGGVLELAVLPLAALGLDGSELNEGLFEEVGDAMAVQAEVAEGLNRGLGRRWGLGVHGLGEQIGFEKRHALETPSGVGEFVDEMVFGGGGRFVLIEELLDMELEGGEVLGGQKRSARGEAMSEGVERGAPPRRPARIVWRCPPPGPLRSRGPEIARGRPGRAASLLEVVDREESEGGGRDVTEDGSFVRRGVDGAREVRAQGNLLEGNYPSV